jgi:hypothetical protein
MHNLLSVNKLSGIEGTGTLQHKLIQVLACFDNFVIVDK